ncbi:Pantoate-beta-alanine ligase-domain-containing protein [Gamsiella multidivaricata]|uniref:Pantoate-beta-alanine ligase-domain-containing protein n=1 Tax=Gamsiella multidivaricata TaxID=101098 RepID=UPI00221EB28A|nr:Pantoate-beta-alanine ligase-domain-containing protein [Gamsiella multidivaricata]KAI7816152.1 Pantoate-beta-alanine ligase-domain-containing protein [Gamsiella multidivaricata]
MLFAAIRGPTLTQRACSACFSSTTRSYAFIAPTSSFRRGTRSPLAQQLIVTRARLIDPPESAILIQPSLSSSSITHPLGEIPVFDTIAAFREWRKEITRQNKTVGFVPTMGALHDGHLGLVQTARQECDAVVVSIFVNPAQFAPHEDLDQYPRTFDTDYASLVATKACSAILLPKVSEMYPAGITLDRTQQRGAFVEVVGLSHQMEGIPRPHFFRGVATIVTKLFNIVQPDRAYFGQKDAQQCAVLRAMIRDLLLPIKMRAVPTSRETDGLAMSSRNRYLTPEMRSVATLLYRAISAAKENIVEHGAYEREEILKPAFAIIEQVAKDVKAKGLPFEVRLDYLSLVDVETLSELQQLGKTQAAVLSGAVYVGTTRLIDNVLINTEEL